MIRLLVRIAFKGVPSHTCEPCWFVLGSDRSRLNAMVLFVMIVGGIEAKSPPMLIPAPASAPAATCNVWVESIANGEILHDRREARAKDRNARPEIVTCVAGNDIVRQPRRASVDEGVMPEPPK